MADTTQLETVIARVANDRALIQHGEPATRQAAIDPVLQALGWDFSNLDEVYPEYSLRSGARVDYSLRVGGQNRVFIEAKAAKVRLDASGHRDQVLGYASEVGVLLAVLTNGLEWWLYLPMEPERTWEERRFAHVNFREQEPASTAEKLRRFLSRDAVVSDDAARAARQELERAEHDRRVLAALPAAWGEVLADTQLHHLLTRKVSQIVGREPDERAISEFIRSRSDNVPSPARPTSSGSVPSQSGPASGGAAPTPQTSKQESYAGRRIAAFVLDDRRHSVRSWPRMVSTLAELLMGEAADFAERVATVRGPKRRWFSNDPADLVSARQLANSPLYVEANLAPDAAVRMARRVLRAVRGNDDGFSIELAD